MRCGFCGYEFKEEEGNQGCSSCPMSSGCKMIKCPRCNYENPARTEDAKDGEEAFKARADVEVTPPALLTGDTMKLTEHAEEILESLWIEAVEEGRGNAQLSALKLEPQDAGVAELLSRGLVEVRDGRIFFTRTGREEGRTTIRRHRLAERLMMDILDIRGQSGDEKACQFEHLLNEGVDIKVCTMLNHPTTCPHGKPIPAGACCEEARKAGDLGVVPLTELKCGEEGDIAYIQTDDSKKMQKLMAMGVLPGNRILLVQAYPSYVFRVGYSEFAIDTAMAREIFVRK